MFILTSISNSSMSKACMPIPVRMAQSITTNEPLKRTLAQAWSETSGPLAFRAQQTLQRTVELAGDLPADERAQVFSGLREIASEAKLFSIVLPLAGKVLTRASASTVNVLIDRECAKLNLNPKTFLPKVPQSPTPPTNAIYTNAPKNNTLTIAV